LPSITVIKLSGLEVTNGMRKSFPGWPGGNWCSGRKYVLHIGVGRQTVPAGICGRKPGRRFVILQSKVSKSCCG